MSSRCFRTLLLVLPLLAVACGDDPEGGPPPALTPPTVREIEPTGGPIAGNTLINVYGAGFKDGAKLYLGEQEALRTVVVNAFRIYGYTPQSLSAKVDVRVVNPDGAYGVLVKGFTYEGPPSPNIDQAEIINTNRELVSNGAPVGVMVEGSITVAGLTRGTGQGPGVLAQVGFAPGTSDVLNQESYTWDEAAYFRDSDSGEGDLYRGLVQLQAPIGGENREWVIAIRFSIDGGNTWVMADGDGIANGLSSSLMRRVFISRPRVDYCKLGPDGNRANLSIFYQPTSTTLTNVVGQVYAQGITDSSGAGSGLTAQVGYGPANSDPRDANAGWTWINATYKTDIGNNDEFGADLPNPGTVGTWRVAMRFSISENTWRVCDVNGVNDSTEGDLTFDLNRLGILTVGNEAPKPPVEWCKLGENDKAPEDINYQTTTQPAALKTVFAQVYMTGVTPNPGAGAGLVAELGYGPSGSDPREGNTGWTWTAMTFNRDQFGANDEWKGTLPNPGTLGNYSYAVRFRVDGGPVRVCDGNGHNDEPANPFELEQLGKLTVTGEPTTNRVVGYCKLGAAGNNDPETVNYVTGQQASRNVLGRVWIQGVTEGAGAGTGIVGQLGWGPAGENPATSQAWTWAAAAFKEQSGNDEEYEATLPNPNVVGSYRFAYRFQVNGGAFLLCDSDGNTGNLGGFDAAKTGTLNVTSEPVVQRVVGYCKLGPNGVNTAPAVSYATDATANITVLGQAYVEGVTNGGGAGTGVVAQLGWGPAGSDPREPSAGWTWGNATYRDEVGNNDQFQATLPNPGVVGTYRFAYRFQVNGGAFLLCDADGTSGDSFNPELMGTLTVADNAPKPPVDWCKLGAPDAAPEAITYLNTQTTGLREVVGQVFMAGVTPAPGAGAGLVAELGYGPAGSDPRSSIAWVWSPMTFSQDRFNSNDEWTGTLPNPGVLGNYSYAVRFSANGGPVRVCDGNGHNDEAQNPFELDQLGRLTVSEPVVQRVVGFCKLGAAGNNNPETVSYVTGQQGTRGVVGRVWVQGVTEGAGAGTGIVGQLGWGPAGADPATSEAWTWAAATFKEQSGNDEEYEATLPNPNVVGSYRFAYRFQVNGGAFLLCDSDGNDGTAGGFDAARMGTLTVTSEPEVPRVVGYCKLGPDGNNTPQSLTYTTRAPASHVVVGQAFVEGVTAGAGAGAGVVAQLGWGPANSDPRDGAGWTWTNATYQDEVANNDQFQATLPNPGAAGSYRFAYRFQVNGGAFLLCDADGTSGGPTDFDPALTGTLTVPLPAVTWCKLGANDQPPEDISYLNTQTTGLREVLGQVYLEGVTDTPGAGAGLVAELGHGPAGTDPRSDNAWTWTAMTFNRDMFSVNEEWRGTLPNPGVVGSYSYAVRFSANDGPVRVCDGNGHGDESTVPFELDQLGRLSVTSETVVPRVVGWCKLGPDGNNTPQSLAYAAGEPASHVVVGQAYVDGVTAGTGAGAGLVAQLGWGPEGENPATSAAWVWTAGTYRGDIGNNDEFQATLPNPGVAGSYRFAYRFQVNGGDFLLCDADGNVGDAFDTALTGALAVQAPAPAVCRLRSVSGTTVGSGDAVTVTGRVRIPGVTDGDGPGANIQVQVGVGAANVDASTTPAGFTWKAAPYTREAEGEAATDEFATTVHPAYEGSRAVSMRYSTDGETWTYCDKDGSDVGGYSAGQQHALTVNKHTALDYCNLQWPFSLPVSGGDRTVYGQLYEDGVTNQGGATPGLTAELGYGSTAQDPGVAGWTWVAATFRGDAGSNDEFTVALPEGLAAGTAYTYRYRLNDGPYCYGDRANAGGNGRFGDGFSGDTLGTVTP